MRIQTRNHGETHRVGLLESGRPRCGAGFDHGQDDYDEIPDEVLDEYQTRYREIGFA